MSPTPADSLAVAIVPTCCATMAVALRFYVRARRAIGLGRDDWTSLVSLVLTWCLAAVVFVGVAIGVVGGHTPIDPVTGKSGGIGDKRKIVKVTWVSLFVMPLAYGVIKLSVMFLYQRLFIGTFFRWYSNVMNCILVAWTIAFAFSFAFQCGTHPEWWWTSLDTAAQCTDSKKSNMAFAVSDVITDLMVLATPLPIIWRLQKSVGDRIGLTLIFGLGLLSTAAAIVRLAYIIVGDWASTPGARDLLAMNTIDLVWGHTEAAVGVIAACLPTLKPLVHGRSPETLLYTIRSKLSLHSSGVPTKRDSYERDVEKYSDRSKILETRSWKVEKSTEHVLQTSTSSFNERNAF